MAEKGAPIKGKFLEILGNYNPRLKTKAFKNDRILYWLSMGAKASPTVHNLLVSEKIVEGQKVKAWASKHKEGAKAGVEEKKEGATENHPEGGHPEGEKPATKTEGSKEEKPVDEKSAGDDTGNERPKSE